MSDCPWDGVKGRKCDHPETLAEEQDAVEEAFQVAERVLLRMKDQGCDCRPLIQVEQREGYWWIDVQHTLWCAHPGADEFIDSIAPDGTDA